MILQDLLDEIENLKKAKDLLQEIWLEFDPCQRGKIEDKTWNKVNDYFGFDDSE